MQTLCVRRRSRDEVNEALFFYGGLHVSRFAEDAAQPAAKKQKTAKVDDSFGEPNHNIAKEIGRHGHAVRGHD